MEGMMKKFSLKSRLMNGEFIVGPWVLSENPAFVEIAGLVGYDFVYLDLEHTTTTLERLEKMILAAKGVDTPVIVRVDKNDPVTIRKVLEIGAEGVLVPHIETKEEAEEAVRAAKFPPEGIRGAAGTVRSACYSVDDWSEYIDQSNRGVLVCALVETKEGIDNIDDIVSVKELDVVCFGAGDYSVSVGVPGQGLNAPQVREAFEKLIKAAKKEGVFIWFSPMQTLEAAKDFVHKGVQIMMSGTDQGAFHSAQKDAMNKIVKKLREDPP